MNTLKPHGTLAAYRRHQRAHTSPCTPCRTAYNTDQRRRRAARGPVAEPVEPFAGTWVRKGLIWYPEEAA